MFALLPHLFWYFLLYSPSLPLPTVTLITALQPHAPLALRLALLPLLPLHLCTLISLPHPTGHQMCVLGNESELATPGLPKWFPL